MWFTLLAAIVIVSVGSVILKIYIKLTTGWCRSPVCLVGKTVVITGANTGIGYETALDMAMRGAKVILACRNKNKALEARDKIVRETDNPNIHIKIIDMSSFESVRNCAKEIKESENRLDILINNAGSADLPISKTKDGYQLTMQTNYYSPALLTLLLIDLLKKTPNSRIVNVSSVGAKYAKLNLNDPDEIPDNSTIIQYCNTKLCNILFTIELARRLSRTSITTYSLHPGAVYTEIFRYMHSVARNFMIFLAKNFFKTAKEGAQTQIHCAVEKGIESLSGEHFVDCAKVAPYKTVNIEDAEVLWNKTLEIINLKPEDISI